MCPLAAVDVLDGERKERALQQRLLQECPYHASEMHITQLHQIHQSRQRL